MKKTNLVKVVSILLVSLMVILFTTNVFAADNDTSFQDLTSTLNNTTENNTSKNTNSNTNSNNANKNTNNTNSNTNSNNTNNSSIYNNTDLPKTGVESSIPVVVLVAVFGISAVYAYKKVNDYKNV